MELFVEAWLPCSFLCMWRLLRVHIFMNLKYWFWDWETMYFVLKLRSSYCNRVIQLWCFTVMCISLFSTPKREASKEEGRRNDSWGTRQTSLLSAERLTAFKCFFLVLYSFDLQQLLLAGLVLQARLRDSSPTGVTFPTMTPNLILTHSHISFPTFPPFPSALWGYKRRLY